MKLFFRYVSPTTHMFYLAVYWYSIGDSIEDVSKDILYRSHIIIHDNMEFKDTGKLAKEKYMIYLIEFSCFYGINTEYFWKMGYDV